MASVQPVFAESNACARQTEPGCRHVITEQRPLRGIDAPSAGGSGNLGDLMGIKAEINLFTSKYNSHCLTYYLKDMDALAHDWPNLLLYAFPPITLLPQAIRRIREHKHKVLLVAPLWRNQHWLSELSQLLTAAPWPIPLRQDLLSQANNNVASPARAVGSVSLASRWELTDLPESIQNTISQARAPSTRCLYALKWSVFTAWCSTRGQTLFPVTYC